MSAVALARDDRRGGRAVAPGVRCPRGARPRSRRGPSLRPGDDARAPTSRRRSACGFDFIRQRTQREAVNDDEGVVWNGGENVRRLLARRRMRHRKAVVELVDGHGPAALTKAGHDPPVVSVSARQRLEPPGNDESTDEGIDYVVASSTPCVERRGGHVRLVQRHPDALDAVRAGAEIAAADGADQTIEHKPRQELGRRVATLQGRFVVQVAIAQRRRARRGPLRSPGRCRSRSRSHRSRDDETRRQPRRSRRATAVRDRTRRRAGCAQSSCDRGR